MDSVGLLSEVQLEHELGQQRDPRQAAELEQGRAQAVLDAEQRLRARLEQDLDAAAKRLAAAETARDAAIATLEQAAARGTAGRRGEKS